MSNDDFDFSREDDVDIRQVAFEQMAAIMVPMFKAFTKQGLSGQEAAALAAAYWNQNMPIEPEGPRDGS